MGPAPSADAERNPPFARILVLLSLAGLAVFFYVVRGILTPYVWAAILAYVLNPLVGRLERGGLRRSTSVALVYLMFLSLMVLSLYWALTAFWQELPGLRAEWPSYMKAWARVLEQGRSALEAAWPQARSWHVVDRVLEQTGAWAENAVHQAPHMVISAVEWAAYLLLVPFVGFYFLSGTRNLLQRTLDACPGRWVEKVLSLLYKMDEVLGNYIRAVILECLLVGTMSALGLHALGVDYAALIGVAAGLTNMIPYAGPYVGAAIAVPVALLQFPGSTTWITVLVLFAAIHVLDGYGLQPVIMERSIHLNPVLVIFALMCGWELAGVWGLLLAMPLASLAKETGVILFQWYFSERRLALQRDEMAHLALRPWFI